MTMSTPTEEEIRAAVEARSTHYRSDDPGKHLDEAIEDWSNLFAVNAPDSVTGETWGDFVEDQQEPGPDDLWWDLRPTEAARLEAIRQEAVERAQRRAREIVIEELVAAGLRFAEEFPDAPRAQELTEATP